MAEPSSLFRGRVGVGVSHRTPAVTLELDPRVLHLEMHARQVKSPRVKPEGDARWGW